MRLRIPPLPFQLLSVILFVVFFGNLLPLKGVQLFYTFSMLFKEALGLILPFMVFFFVSAGILSFKKNAPVVLGVMLTCIFVSNMTVALFSYGLMYIFSPVIACEYVGISFKPLQELHPLITVLVPFSINAVHALLAAIIIGLIGSFYSLGNFVSVVTQSKKFIENLLQKLFIPLLPLYVMGFLLKTRYEGLLSCLMQQYGSAFFLIVSMQLLYLCWIYVLACGFDLKKALRAINNAWPSYLTAFSTMSSTVTIPVSIKAATQNTDNRALADVAMPIMANVHLLGDSIGTPILAMVTMLLFTGVLPDFMNYLAFVVYFCFSMFAVSGIPGGGILVMIPILKSQLGFTSEMVGIIVTIYFLMDSFGTAANVMGDGALVIIVNRILKRLRIA